jgi:drug/metabolite transporter (DMT)-like permease
MRYYVAIFVTICLYSTVEVVSRYIRGNVDSNFLACVRFLVPGVMMLCMSLRQFAKVKLTDFLILCLLGFVGITLTFSAYHHSLAMDDFKASTGAVIFSINPVFCAVAAWFLLKEKVTGLRVAGVVMGVVGVYVVSFGFYAIDFKTMTAPALMFAAQICFAIYVTAAKRYVGRYGPLFVNGIIFVVGALLFIPLIQSTMVTEPAVTWWWIAYLTFFATGLGYFLYFYGLNKVPIAAGTSMFYLKPVFASVLAVLTLGETLERHFYIGLAIIFLSLTFTIFGGRRTQAR